MNSGDHIRIVEVGPRDGLQNEGNFVSTTTKVQLVDMLSDSGLSDIEVSSFVSPRAIPQLADSTTLFQNITQNKAIRYWALVPNQRGMEAAIAADVRHIAVFAAASEAFSQRNINCSIAQSIARFQEVITMAKAANIKVRGYISCVLGCPYEGQIDPTQVMHVARQLLALGVDELSLGDTIGVGTAKQTRALLRTILSEIPQSMLAMHFHDTYAQAISNIYASLEEGIRSFDSSVAGLGGCPYAQGASGNVATEDVLYLLHGLGLHSGVDIYKIVAAGDMICNALKRPNQSKVANALLGGGALSGKASR
ncbi:MAG: hydroxymethylglutaryl-CoA lyase [Legionellaceae bacterium]|nr:hydroxymethylglutaryl-CoA lyase [Legionellaceae bacterium]